MQSEVRNDEQKTIGFILHAFALVRDRKPDCTRRIAFEKQVRMSRLPQIGDWLFRETTVDPLDPLSPATLNAHHVLKVATRWYFPGRPTRVLCYPLIQDPCKCCGRTSVCEKPEIFKLFATPWVQVGSHLCDLLDANACDDEESDWPHQDPCSEPSCN